MVCDERDYLIDYFGFKTLERSYLMKIDSIIIERPQHMWLRVAVCIHGDNLGKVASTYELMSNKFFTHATPTLFNAGTNRPQLSSCYLIALEQDSINGIYSTCMSALICTCTCMHTLICTYTICAYGTRICVVYID